MDALCVAHMGHETRILIRRLRICALARNVVNSLSVLSLVAGDQINRLLEEVEIEVLIRK